MKNLLAFLGAAVLVFAGVGLYLNWFHIARGPAVAGHKAFNIDLNTDKIESDAQKGGEKVLSAIEKARLEAEKKAQTDAGPVVNGVKADTNTQEGGTGEK